MEPGRPELTMFQAKEGMLMSGKSAGGVRPVTAPIHWLVDAKSPGPWNAHL